jgi:hypothetical protein
VTSGTGQPGRPFSFRPAGHSHGVGNSRIELQRRVAGDMAILTARVLEYLLDGSEGSDRLSPLLRGRPGSASK